MTLERAMTEHPARLSMSDLNSAWLMIGQAKLDLRQEYGWQTIVPTLRQMNGRIDALLQEMEDRRPKRKTI